MPIRRESGVESGQRERFRSVAGENRLNDVGREVDQVQVREYAVQTGEFNRLGYIPAVPKTSAPILLQLWTYPPAIITSAGVDPFSLYLTQKDESDERIQIALDELINEVLW